MPSCFGSVCTSVATVDKKRRKQCGEENFRIVCDTLLRMSELANKLCLKDGLLLNPLFLGMLSLRTWLKPSVLLNRISLSASSNVTEGKLTEDDDGVVKLRKDPYCKPAKQCFLCAQKIELDYKNARLLQQFVSTFSGRVYDQ